MSKLDKWIDNKIVQNVFAWCCSFLVLMATITSENNLLTALYAIAFLVPAIYICNYTVLPFFNKNKALFIILFLLNIGVFTLIAVLIIGNYMDKVFEFKIFTSLFGAVFLAVTFGVAIRISRDSFIRKQNEKEAELQLLKAQLNPHFLFNTLNNLYGLSVIKSDKLPDLMLQLSDLLRYSLYETKDVFVPLEKEISYLENYTSLERIRLDAKAAINFSIKGTIIGKQIAPMLLIVFVENAFKHLEKKQDKKSRVTIIIDVTENSLKFTCENSCNLSEVTETNLEKGKSGIGLVNANKRLSLIYPNAHNLSIKKDNGFFLVDLKLTL